MLRSPPFALTEVAEFGPRLGITPPERSRQSFAALGAPKTFARPSLAKVPRSLMTSAGRPPMRSQGVILGWGGGGSGVRPLRLPPVHGGAAGCERPWIFPRASGSELGIWVLPPPSPRGYAGLPWERSTGRVSAWAARALSCRPLTWAGQSGAEKGRLGGSGRFLPAPARAGWKAPEEEPSGELRAMPSAASLC